MPPKPKCTREEIIEAAFALAREKGMDAVVAREVGKRLNTTPTPIFTVFRNMDEVKAEVFAKAQAHYLDYLQGCFDYTPAFKEFGLRWIRYAKEEPQLFSLLFLSRPEIWNTSAIREPISRLLDEMTDNVAQIFSLKRDQAADVLNQMTVHGLGIATMCINGIADFDDRTILRLIGENCTALVLRHHIADGTLDQIDFETMAKANPTYPTRRSDHNA